MKNEADIAITDKTAKLLPNFLKVCVASNPAKKKSPKPSIIIPFNAGRIGNATTTGRLRLTVVVAAETMVLVTKTKITSIIVNKVEKMSVVFHVNKLPR